MDLILRFCDFFLTRKGRKMFNFTIVTVVLLGLSLVEKEEEGVPKHLFEPPKIEIPSDGKFDPVLTFPDYRYC